GRNQCDLFCELPDKYEYLDYYCIILSPIMLLLICKHINSHLHKTMMAFCNDIQLMFTKAQTHNQEVSWVYPDVVKMEKVSDIHMSCCQPGAPMH
ncbi:Bromodomain-containing protein, partial [Lactarius tabidus]